MTQATQVGAAEQSLKAATTVTAAPSNAEDALAPPPPSATTSMTDSNLSAVDVALADASSGAKVADLDAQRFRLHPSVFFWQEFKSAVNTAWVDPDASLSSSLQHLVQRAAASAPLTDPRAAAYWAYHTARLSYFIGQAAAGLAAHHLSETLPANVTAWLGLDGGVGGSSSGQERGSAPAVRQTPFQRLAARADQELRNRVAEALSTFQQDYDNIRAGYYPLPWDMTPWHRQNDPRFMIRRTLQGMQESTAVFRRRVRNQPEPLWLSSDLYPQYYTKTFHFQTDGWFSDKSARIYEHTTETLFFGRQDAMQRTSLLPLADFVREAGQAGRPASSLRLLEVAAGTGRFHTFIKDAHPDLPSVVSDLSPFYLARARDNLRYWRATRQPGRRLGGVEDTGADFLQTAVEAIAAPDQAFDVVVCVYLFHELPPAARSAAVSEFFRVLRPGGLVVLTDSVQTGDRPAWDNSIGVFGDFNEPYYRNYISTDLGALFESCGFICDTKYVSSATKTLSFRKPGSLNPDAQ